MAHQQDDGLLERQGVSDLHLAVGPLEHAQAQEEDEGGALLNTLEHPLLGEVLGPVEDQQK